MENQQCGHGHFCVVDVPPSRGFERGASRVLFPPVTPKTGPGGPRAARGHVGTSFVRILVQLTRSPPLKADGGRDIQVDATAPLRLV